MKTKYMDIDVRRRFQFINLVSGSCLATSDTLKSCTNDVQLADAFELDGRSILLIDTPAIDNSGITIAASTKMIAAYLAAM